MRSKSTLSIIAASLTLALSLSVSAKDVGNGVATLEEPIMTLEASDRHNPTPVIASKADQVMSIIKLKLGELPIAYVAEEEKSGLFLLRFNDGSMMYTNENVEYLIANGPENNLQIYTIENGQPVNQTPELIQPYNKIIVSDITEIAEYTSPNEKYVITSFIDPACPYCKKMHDEVEEYNKLGITVRFAALPIFGDASVEAMSRLMSLPAKDRGAKMRVLESHFAKSGRAAIPNWKQLGFGDATLEGIEITKKSREAADFLGLTGTPGIVLENGATISGYLPAETMLSVLIKAEEAEKEAANTRIEK